MDLKCDKVGCDMSHGSLNVTMKKIASSNNHPICLTSNCNRFATPARPGFGAVIIRTCKSPFCHPTYNRKLLPRFVISLGRGEETGDEGGRAEKKWGSKLVERCGRGEFFGTLISGEFVILYF